MNCGWFVNFSQSEATSTVENGFKPSAFQTLLARLSARSDNTILTSLSSPARSLGALGENLKNPDSSVSQSSFLPRILSTLPAAPFDSFRASDNSLLSRPSLPVDDIETKGRVLFPAQSVTTLLSPVNSVENDEESGDDESLPISTVIPAILAAMQDKTTSPDQKTSLQSLLTDMVRSARQQVEPAVPGGVDFSQARRTPDGRLCVIKARLFYHNNVARLGSGNIRLKSDWSSFIYFHMTE